MCIRDRRNEVLDEKKKDEMEALIKFDKSEEVAEHRTQDALMQELEQAQALTRLKREELGLVKMFHEFEDVTMATVIGAVSYTHLDVYKRQVL